MTATMNLTGFKRAFQTIGLHETNIRQVRGRGLIHVKCKLIFSHEPATCSYLLTTRPCKTPESRADAGVQAEITGVILAAIAQFHCDIHEFCEVNNGRLDSRFLSRKTRRHDRFATPAGGTGVTPAMERG